jgi:hypothetical protein
MMLKKGMFDKLNVECIIEGLKHNFKKILTCLFLLKSTHLKIVENLSLKKKIIYILFKNSWKHM